MTPPATVNRVCAALTVVGVAALVATRPVGVARGGDGEAPAPVSTLVSGTDKVARFRVAKTDRVAAGVGRAYAAARRFDHDYDDGVVRVTTLPQTDERGCEATLTYVEFQSGAIGTYFATAETELDRWIVADKRHDGILKEIAERSASR